jgi:23S rRNA (adenine2030-N6)-methyltransferase
MRLLGGRRGRFLFCDIDGESLSTISSSARQLGLPDDTVRTVNRDGVVTLLESLAAASDDEASRTFVHIDPYEPFEASDNGLTSVDLFCRVIARGAKAVLWYGFGSMEHRESVREQMSRAMKDSEFDSGLRPLWCGEVVLDAVNDPGYDFDPGVRGCGILCGNLSMETLSACGRLGEGLASVYASAVLPGGRSGAIEFTQATFP